MRACVYRGGNGRSWPFTSTQSESNERGRRAGYLPIEQPRQFILAVNLRTARALRLTIPESILLRANEVIQ
jgi:putative ABC transport system substrate-binding protein